MKYYKFYKTNKTKSKECTVFPYKKYGKKLRLYTHFYLIALALAKGSFVFLAVGLKHWQKTNVPFERWLRLVANGAMASKCWIKLLLKCQPAQMYVKISNVQTNTQPRICYSVCYLLVFCLSSFFIVFDNFFTLFQEF